jgi:hypothetical protein
MTPREPFSKVFQQQPQPAAVSRMAMNMHKYWKIFFQDELGPLPEVVYTQVTISAMLPTASNCQPLSSVANGSINIDVFCCSAVPSLRCRGIAS